ncbi:hypothetical protein EI94DRAFT_1709426, partial [Lactarius quietus]
GVVWAKVWAGQWDTQLTVLPRVPAGATRIMDIGSLPPQPSHGSCMRSLDGWASLSLQKGPGRLLGPPPSLQLTVPPRLPAGATRIMDIGSLLPNHPMAAVSSTSTARHSLSLHGQASLSLQKGTDGLPSLQLTVPPWHPSPFRRAQRAFKPFAVT